MFIMRHAQSEFNVHFNATGRDPGIRDPHLTAHGRRQATDAARALAAYDLRRIVASPYRRAVQTAEIIAEKLRLDVTIQAEIGEHSMYHCDIGSDPKDLAALWPHRDFSHLPPNWWPATGETRSQVKQRCEQFEARAAAWPDFDHLLVVSHWGFIATLTGVEIPNASVLRLKPAPAYADAPGLFAELDAASPPQQRFHATLVYQPSA